LLSGGELCVCYFVEILGEPQPKISRHLAYLRRAGLVTARRDGKWMHYELAQSSPVLDAVLAAIESDKQVQKDRAALERACCGVRVPAGLVGAPARGALKRAATPTRT
ncbi:MAG TPA: metalloregulator ArsR/SmtB family transcription factor, partial [Thermoanaerobaculia bacterium]|nr:metalloregulator ArsR/SmtB family transcription factor [Thermoanaerobaculia bacterium]